MVEYVMTPNSFSLYRKGDREVALFGDRHDITAGAGGNPPSRIQISEYLRRRLEDNPNLHVYGEIAEDEPDGFDLYPGSTNIELKRLRDMKNDETFPYRDRIHNIDIRNSVVPPRDWDKPVHITHKRVKKHLRQRARELLRKKNDTHFIGAEDDMYNFFEKSNERKPRGMNELQWWRYLENEEYKVKTSLLQPVVEAEIIDTVRMNPHRAKSMIFYTGDGHKGEAELHFFDKEWDVIHKARARADSSPIAVGGFDAQGDEQANTQAGVQDEGQAGTSV
jgi:hypothetical protein